MSETLTEPAVDVAGPPTMDESPSTTDRPIFNFDDLHDLPDSPEFKALPDEDRARVLDTAIADVHAQAAAEPGYDYETFGKFADQMRQRAAPGKLKTFGKSVGTGLLEMGKDLASIPGAALPGVAHPIEVGKTIGQSFGTNAADWVRGAVDFGQRHLSGTTKELHKQTDQLITDIKAGKFPHDDPDQILTWLKERDAKLHPLQMKHHGERLAGSNRLSTPDSAALIASYIQTRNPAALDELKHRLTVTSTQDQIAQQRAANAQSKGAQAFEDVYGKGSAEHLQAGYDPANFAFVARGAAALKGASRLSRASRFAAEMSAFGLAGAMRSNPDLSPADAGEEVLKMILMGGVIHGAAHAIKRLRPTTKDSSPTSSQPAENSNPPTVSTHATALKLFGEDALAPTAHDVAPLEPAPPSEPHGLRTNLPPATERGNVNPQLFSDAARVGYTLLRDGLRDFSKWSNAMLKKFGDWIREHLNDLWSALKEHFTYVHGASQRGAIQLGSPVERAKAQIAETRRTLGQKLDARQTKGMIAAMEDIIDSKPSLTARQAANHVRATFGFVRTKGVALWKYILTGKDTTNARAIADMEAAPFVVEAYQAVHSAKSKAAALSTPPGITLPVTVLPGEAYAALQTQRARVAAYVRATGKGKPYLASMDHALANFVDLDAKSQSAHTLMKAARAQELRYGIESGEVKHYVTHIYGNLDSIRGRNAPQEMFGGTDPGQTGSKYFTKGRTFETLADAIAAGYEPLSTNIADLAEHRIKAGQKLVERAKNVQALFAATDPATGAPLALPTAPGQRPPANYQSVQAGGTEIYVYEPYHGFFRALYQPSAIRNSTAGRAIIRIVQGIKHGTTVFDMLHLMRVLGRQLFTTGSVNLRRSQALLEYTPTEIASMVHAGELTPKEAAWINKERPTFQKLQDAGLNIGRVSDALWMDTVGIFRHAIEHFVHPVLTGPLRGIEEFNKLVFDKATRSGMVECSLKFYERNRKHGLSEGEAARLAALEVNRLFGNVGRQGVFRSRTMQDFARIFLFAPQWMEGTLSSEIQGAAQSVGAVIDKFTGQRVRAANTAKLMIATATGMFLAGQVINYATTGHSTLENEEGHKMDAWLPGGHYGFWMSPFTFLNSFLESFHRYYEDQQPRTMDDKLNAGLNAIERIGANKLSGPMRGVWTTVSGRDYRGRPIDTFQGRITEGIMSASPLPIPLSPILERNPGEWPRFSMQGNEPGAWERQAAASIGIHLLPAQGPVEKMYALARPFRTQSTGAVHEPSKYTLVRRAIRNGDMPRLYEEMTRLISEGKATLKNMDEAMGIPGGAYHAPKFTGSIQSERDLLKSLSPEDRKTYAAAISESRKQALIYWRARRAQGPALFKLQQEAFAKGKMERADLIRAGHQ